MLYAHIVRDKYVTCTHSWTYILPAYPVVIYCNGLLYIETLHTTVYPVVFISSYLRIVNTTPSVMNSFIFYCFSLGMYTDISFSRWQWMKTVKMITPFFSLDDKCICMVRVLVQHACPIFFQVLSQVCR